jgi:hypothetical protein
MRSCSICRRAGIGRAVALQRSSTWIIFVSPKPNSMRLTLRGLLAFLLAGLVLIASSCREADHPAAGRPAAGRPAATVDSTPVYDRAILVQALKELRARILSEDKAQTGGIFRFPVSSMAFSTHINDRDFPKQEAQHGDSITQDMFYTYFETIDANVDMDEFRKLFTYLNPDSLLTKDQIEYDTIVSPECFRGYIIQIEGNNLVSISYGLSTMINYPGKKPEDTARNRHDMGGKPPDTLSSDDPLDNPEPCWSPNDGTWEFIFDGKRLWFRDLSFGG